MGVVVLVEVVVSVKVVGIGIVDKSVCTSAVHPSNCLSVSSSICLSIHVYVRVYVRPFV